MKRRYSQLWCASLIVMVLTPLSFADEESERSEIPDYTLAINNDETVCRHMLELYNNDLKEQGYLTIDHPEFDWVEWEDMHYSNSYDEQRMEMTKFDMDNDGQDETVIRDFFNSNVQADFYPQPTGIIYKDIRYYNIYKVSKRVDNDLYNISIKNAKKNIGILNMVYPLWSDSNFKEYQSVLTTNMGESIDSRGTLHHGFFYFRKFFSDAYYYPMKLNNQFYIVRFGFYTDDIDKSVSTETEGFKKKTFKETNFNIIYKFDAKESPRLYSGSEQLEPLISCIFIQYDN